MSMGEVALFNLVCPQSWLLHMLMGAVVWFYSAFSYHQLSYELGGFLSGESSLAQPVTTPSSPSKLVGAIAPHR